MSNNDLPLELQLLIARSSMDTSLRQRLLEHPVDTMRINGVDLAQLPTIQFVEYGHGDDGFDGEVMTITLPAVEQTGSITSAIKRAGKLSSNQLAASGYNGATVEQDVAVATTTVEATEVNTTAAVESQVAVTEAEAVATTTTEATETETTAAVVSEVVLVAT